MKDTAHLPLEGQFDVVEVEKGGGNQKLLPSGGSEKYLLMYDGLAPLSMDSPSQMRITMVGIVVRGRKEKGIG